MLSFIDEFFILSSAKNALLTEQSDTNLPNGVWNALATPTLLAMHLQAVDPAAEYKCREH